MLKRSSRQLRVTASLLILSMMGLIAVAAGFASLISALFPALVA